MKILVVDDSTKHLDAAREQLAGIHDCVFTDSYVEAVKRMQEGVFDILLSDLLMPAEGMTLGPEGQRFVGQLMPAGLFLAFVPALHRVQYVAVITDANHHNHPASAAIDWLSPAYWSESGNEFFSVDGARVFIAHAKLRDDGAKDWAAALAVLCCKS